jgi:hypothetical protein
MKGKIRVYCRLRPLSEKEIGEKEREAVTAVDEFTVEFLWKDDKPKQYIYDRVFGSDANQESVFEDTRASLTITPYRSILSLKLIANCFMICAAVFGAICCRWL